MLTKIGVGRNGASSAHALHSRRSSLAFRRCSDGPLLPRTLSTSLLADALAAHQKELWTEWRMACTHRYSIRRQVCFLFRLVVYFYVIFFQHFCFILVLSMFLQGWIQEFFFDFFIVFILYFIRKKNLSLGHVGFVGYFFLKLIGRFVERFFLTVV